MLLLIFWYSSLASVANFWTQTHVTRYVPVSFKKSLFYQIQTLIAYLCFLLLNLKMSITISNWGFIWKYQRYARKFQNDATTNQIILKTLIWGEWSSGLSRSIWIGKLLVQTSLGAVPGFGNQPHYDPPSSHCETPFGLKV